MKANEIEDGKVLMIDDLVIGCIETDIVGEATYKILCKVTDINHYGDVSCKAIEPFPDELDWQDGDDFSWIEPITLTPEILEKNGFTDWADHSRTTRSCSLLVDKTNIIVQKIDGTDYIFTQIRRGGAGSCEFRMDLKYVHELQHALKLCGIKKTIEL